MKLAIYDDGVFVREIERENAPVLPGKPYRKFYEVITVEPKFDRATQVRTGPVTTEDHIAETRTHTWTVRDKTAEELDQDKEVRIDAMDVLGFKIDFNHENRIRALEGKQPVSAAQFRAALKDML